MMGVLMAMLALASDDLCTEAKPPKGTHAALVEPSAARIQKVVGAAKSMRLRIGGGGVAANSTIELNADKTFAVEGAACKAAGPYEISGSVVKLSCEGGGHFEVRVRAISCDVMQWGGLACLGGSCSTNDGLWTADGAQGCTQRCAPALQVIPGAADRALFDKIVERLKAGDAWGQAGWSGRPPPLLFLGEPAKKPRVKSEIFLASGHGVDGLDAQVVARVLEPLLGPVKVQAWPGKWQYGIVVVAGSEK